MLADTFLPTTECRGVIRIHFSKVAPDWDPVPTELHSGGNLVPLKTDSTSVLAKFRQGFRRAYAVQC